MQSDIPLIRRWIRTELEERQLSDQSKRSPSAEQVSVPSPIGSLSAFTQWPLTWLFVQWPPLWLSRIGPALILRPPPGRTYDIYKCGIPASDFTFMWGSLRLTQTDCRTVLGERELIIHLLNMPVRNNLSMEFVHLSSNWCFIKFCFVTMLNSALLIRVYSYCHHAIFHALKEVFGSVWYDVILCILMVIFLLFTV